MTKVFVAVPMSSIPKDHYTRFRASLENICSAI